VGGELAKIRVAAASGWRRAAKRAAAGCLRDQHDLERCARAVRRPGPPPRAGQGAERAPSPPSARRFFVGGDASSGGVLNLNKINQAPGILKTKERKL
jgi:hypothetical protein